MEEEEPAVGRGDPRVREQEEDIDEDVAARGLGETGVIAPSRV